MSELLCQIDGPVATLTLNRPAACNAIDAAMAEAMEAALDRLEADHTIRVTIVTGSGGNFSAGADLKAIAAGSATLRHPARGGFAGFVRYPRTKPVIAAVHGYALGGGLEIVLASDITVASDDAVFALPEVTLGLVAAGGGAFRLPRMIPPARARELLLTGERFGAHEAHALGLVNHVVPAAEVLPTAGRIAGTIAAFPPLAVRETLSIARAATDLDEAEAWRRSAAAATRTAESGERQAGARSFAEGRAHREADRPAPGV
jgi:enoyl-CoA hydratase/carnithine racemase